MRFFFGKTELAKVSRLSRNEKQINRYDQIDEEGAFEWVNFRKPGSMRVESPKMFYPIFVSDNSIRLPSLKLSEDKQEWIILEKPAKNESIIYPIDEDGKERRWRWGIERFASEIHELKAKKLKNKLHVYVKGRINDEGVLPMTWWDKKEYSSTAYGTNLLKDIFSELQIFSYPKSLYAVIDCIKIMSDKKDSTVLDFFAGSGTTGHAVMELNKQDDGNRKFILCTNNENEICEKVTYERNKRIIKGYKNKKGEAVEGLGGNLKYYRTAFVDTENINKISDESKIKMTYQVGEMIALRENILDEVEKNNWWQIFSNDQKQLAIYFEENKHKLQTLIKKLDKENKPTILYIFSWGKNEYKNEFSDYKNIRVEDIPEPILAVYKEINKL